MLYQKTQDHYITKGPSLDSLCDAFKYCCDEDNFHTVRFVNKDGEKYVAKVTALKRLGRYSSTVEIEGACVLAQYYDKHSLLCSFNNFSGTYNTRDRIGLFEIISYTADDKPSAKSATQ